jgi:hypothetical protein
VCVALSVRQWFESYQPFAGLQVKNKTGALQKVEDLYAEVVYMYMRGDNSSGAQQAAPASGRSRGTSSGGLFGFGSSFLPSPLGGSSSSSASSSSSNDAAGNNGSGLFVATGTNEAVDASATPSSSASTLSASVPSLKHPMNWHLYPYLHILLVSPATMDEYMRVTKPQIKRFLEYFASPQPSSAPTPSGASSSSSSSSAATLAPPGSSGGGGGGGGSRATTPVPPSAGMVVAGSSLVPELRYHSEVLIIYCPLLDTMTDTSAAAAAAAAAAPSTPTGLASLFKRSSSSPQPLSAAARAEEQASALKSARKVFERMKIDFAGPASKAGADATTNSQVARIDLHEILRAQEREAAQTAAAAAAASGNAAAAATAAAALAASAPLLDAGELSHQFDDVVSRVVRCLIRTNESRATLYELELRKALQHSQMSGWNFCAFFVLKVSSSFACGMGRKREWFDWNMRCSFADRLLSSVFCIWHAWLWCDVCRRATPSCISRWV